jgi:hypothetical protein
MPSPGWIGITWRHSRRSVERRGQVTSDWCRPSAPMLDPDLSAKNCLFHSYLAYLEYLRRDLHFGAISSLAPRALSNMVAALSRRVSFPLAAYPQVSHGRSR